MAEQDVVTSNSVFEILEEWEAQLKAGGYFSENFVVDKPEQGEPQP